MKIYITEKSALVVVDVQKDFCPGGALPVPDGDKVVPVLNTYVTKFVDRKLPIFFTRDWHPEDHISFKARGGPWPPHCIQNSPGAEFHPDLIIPPGSVIVSKATESDKDAYSGFQGTALAEQLTQHKVRRLFVGGLATDYCVKNTILDGLDEGFEVVFLYDGSRGVDVQKGDSEKAIDEMLRKGAILITLDDIR